VPPTYPITNGTLDNAQGVTEVRMPASMASNGASQIVSVIALDKVSSHPFIIIPSQYVI